MTLQELSEHYQLRAQLEKDEDILYNLRMAAIPSAHPLDGMPRAPGVSDKVGALAIAIVDILFGLFVDRVPSIRRIMQSKVMFYFIGLLTLFQTWTQMSGIYEIFGDTPIGTSGGMVIVYITCAVFLIMLLKDGMIRNVLSDGFSWVVVYGLLGVVVVAALIYTRGAFASIDMGTNAAGIKAGVYNGLLLLPGPFACPYYYSLYEYNDSNADGTRRSNIKMSFVWAGLMFGIYMVLAALLTWVRFSPVLNVMKAILITVIAISSLSTYLYCEYLVFGKKIGFALDVFTVASWQILIPLGVMGIWQLMSTIRIYVVLVAVVISIAVNLTSDKKEAAQ